MRRQRDRRSAACSGPDNSVLTARRCFEQAKRMLMHMQVPAKDTSCSGCREVSRTSHRTRPRKAAKARPLQERWRAMTLSICSTPTHEHPELQRKGTRGCWEERAV